MDSLLRIHHIEWNSKANGPGNRVVIWTQGCTLNCLGCFNPETHPSDQGQLFTFSELIKGIEQNNPSFDGITFSGGEPLQQLDPLIEWVQLLKQKFSTSILIFTGFRWEEVNRFSKVNNLLNHIDGIICGRYDQNLRIANGLIGSSNKTVHLLSSKIKLFDLIQTPQTEIMIEPDGSIFISGIDPLIW